MLRIFFQIFRASSAPVQGGSPTILLLYIHALLIQLHQSIMLFIAPDWRWGRVDRNEWCIWQFQQEYVQFPEQHCQTPVHNLTFDLGYIEVYMIQISYFKTIFMLSVHTRAGLCCLMWQITLTTIESNKGIILNPPQCIRVLRDFSLNFGYPP